MAYAVKMVAINHVWYKHFYYVSKIIAGTLAGGHYTYTVEISVSDTFITAGDLIMRFTTSSPTVPKTGMEKLDLIATGSGGSTSGYYGSMAINWSLLTLGATYTCVNWPEGGIYAPVPLDAATTPPTPIIDPIVIPVDTSPPSLNGSIGVYVFNSPSTDMAFVIAPIADVVGNIVLKNLSPTYNVDIKGTLETETFDVTKVKFRILPGETVILKKTNSTVTDFLVMQGTLHYIPA